MGPSFAPSKRAAGAGGNVPAPRPLRLRRALFYIVLMAEANALAVIPALMNDPRFPGRPLKEMSGKTLIQRVWRAAAKAKAVKQLVLITDHQDVVKHAQKIGADAVLLEHPAPSDFERLGQVVKHYSARRKKFPIVALIPGDMPLMSAQCVDRAVQLLSAAPKEVGVTTVAAPIVTDEEFQLSAVIKVVLGTDHTALYFSRSPVPFWKDRSNTERKEPFGYRHVPVYAFRPEALQSMLTSEPSLAERHEKLPAVRTLACGSFVRVALVESRLVTPYIQVGTPEELERARLTCTFRD